MISMVRLRLFEGFAYCVVFLQPSFTDGYFDGVKENKKRKVKNLKIFFSILE
jgi:hypothetical protein